MSKGIDWKCTIDHCGEEAFYHSWPNYFCHKHWWEYLKQPPHISEEEIQRRNEEWRRKHDATRDNAK